MSTREREGKRAAACFGLVAGLALVLWLLRAGSGGPPGGDLEASEGPREPEIVDAEPRRDVRTAVERGEDGSLPSLILHVKDFAGAAIPRARAYAATGIGRYLRLESEALLGTAEADDEGRVVFRGLAFPDEGAVDLLVLAAGFRTAEVADVEEGGEYEVQLAPAARVELAVEDLHGKPVPGLRFSLAAAATPDAFQLEGEAGAVPCARHDAIFVGDTDAEGKLSFVHLVPGAGYAIELLDRRWALWECHPTWGILAGEGVTECKVVVAPLVAAVVLAEQDELLHCVMRMGSRSIVRGVTMQAMDTRSYWLDRLRDAHPGGIAFVGHDMREAGASGPVLVPAEQVLLARAGFLDEVELRFDPVDEVVPTVVSAPERESEPSRISVWFESEERIRYVPQWVSFEHEDGPWFEREWTLWKGATDQPVPAGRYSVSLQDHFLRVLCEAREVQLVAGEECELVFEADLPLRKRKVRVELPDGSPPTVFRLGMSSGGRPYPLMGGGPGSTVFLPVGFYEASLHVYGHERRTTTFVVEGTGSPEGEELVFALTADGLRVR